MSPSTRRGVTEQAAIAAIDSGTRVLRLPTIRDRFEEIAAAAQREHKSSPNERNGQRSRSPALSRSPAGPRPSPTRGCAPRSSTA